MRTKNTSEEQLTTNSSDDDLSSNSSSIQKRIQKSMRSSVYKISFNWYLNVIYLTGSLFEDLKQQRLAAWQPILTATTVLPTLLLLAGAAIAAGVALLYISSRVQQLEIDYTYCYPIVSQNVFGIASCAETIATHPNKKCSCFYQFELKEDYTSLVYIYYALNNYYQSHRLYENSFDEKQLMGEPQASNYCIPFQYKLINGRQVNKNTKDVHFYILTFIKMLRIY